MNSQQPKNFNRRITQLSRQKNRPVLIEKQRKLVLPRILRRKQRRPESLKRPETLRRLSRLDLLKKQSTPNIVSNKKQRKRKETKSKKNPEEPRKKLQHPRKPKRRKKRRPETLKRPDSLMRRLSRLD
jgi:hypothetical protein